MTRFRYLIISVLSLALFLAGGFIMLRAMSFRPPVDARIDTTATERPIAGQSMNGPVLRVAVSAMVSPRDTFESYAGFVQYLADELGMESELIVRKTYGEVNQLLAAGEVDVAFICTGAYVLSDDRDSMRLLVSPVVRGQESYCSDVLVPIDSPARSLADLQGGSFAYVDELSNTGRGAPRRLLGKRGFDPDTFFAESIITGSHDKSVRIVAAKLVDGASVDHLIYEAMVLEGNDDALAVRVVERIGPFGMPPVVVPADLDSGLAQRIRAVFLAAGNDSKARVYLEVLGIDGFRVPSEREYDSVTETETLTSVIIDER